MSCQRRPQSENNKIRIRPRETFQPRRLDELGWSKWVFNSVDMSSTKHKIRNTCVIIIVPACYKYKYLTSTVFVLFNIKY